MRRKIALSTVLLILVSLGLAACGGDDECLPTDPTCNPPPPVPAAVIQVSGNGDIAVHPSAIAAFAVTVEFPIRIQETGGGTADWNFFRVSYFRNGVEIERNEQGADEIQAAGFHNIAARASVMPNVFTRANSVDWDDVELRLGFTDKKDGREFEEVLDIESFTGVILDLTPAMLPDSSHFAIVESRQ